VLQRAAVCRSVLQFVAVFTFAFLILEGVGLFEDPPLLFCTFNHKGLKAQDHHELRE